MHFQRMFKPHGTNGMFKPITFLTMWTQNCWVMIRLDSNRDSIYFITPCEGIVTNVWPNGDTLGHPKAF